MTSEEDLNIKKVPGENALPPPPRPPTGNRLGRSVPLKTCITPESKTTSNLVQNHASKITISFAHVIGSLKPVEKVANYSTQKCCFLKARKHWSVIKKLRKDSSV